MDENLFKKRTKQLALRVIKMVAMLFAHCLPASAQQPTKIPRIGYLSGGFPCASALLGILLDDIRSSFRGKGVDINGVFFNYPPR